MDSPSISLTVVRPCELHSCLSYLCSWLKCSCLLFAWRKQEHDHWLDLFWCLWLSHQHPSQYAFSQPLYLTLFFTTIVWQSRLQSPFLSWHRVTTNQSRWSWCDPITVALRPLNPLLQITTQTLLWIDLSSIDWQRNALQVSSARLDLCHFPSRNLTVRSPGLLEIHQALHLGSSRNACCWSPGVCWIPRSDWYGD